MASLGSSIGLSILLSVVMGILCYILPISFDDGHMRMGMFSALVLFVFGFAYLVALVWSTICIGIKRYHDLNKPGVWILIAFVPAVGSLIYFIQAGCSRGTIGPNEYGADPLAA